MGGDGSAIRIPIEELGFTFFAWEGEKDLPLFLGRSESTYQRRQNTQKEPREKRSQRCHGPETFPPLLPS